jgi:uncharacterized membrane protein
VSRYEFLLFVHVLCAAAWLGGGIMLVVLGARFERARDTAGTASVFSQAEWLATRFFPPISLAVLVAGLLLVWDGGWSWHALWIEIGYIGFAATFVTGFFVLGPQAKKAAAIIERDGGVSAEANDGIRRLFVLMRIDYAVLAMVIADMTLKPNPDDIGVLVGMAAVVAIVAALVLRTLREPAPHARSG